MQQILVWKDFIYLCLPVSSQHWEMLSYSYIHKWIGPSLVLLMACHVLSYLNQCWLIVHCTIRNKFQCNLNLNMTIFIQGNVFENVVCKMAGILFRPQYVFKAIWLTNPMQCWKFPQVRQSEVDNFVGGLGTFCWFFFNFMLMIWDWRHEDLQLFWLSFKHWPHVFQKTRRVRLRRVRVPRTTPRTRSSSG